MKRPNAIVPIMTPAGARAMARLAAHYPSERGVVRLVTEVAR